MCHKPHYFIFFQEREGGNEVCGGERRHSSCPFPAGASLLRKTEVIVRELCTS